MECGGRAKRRHRFPKSFGCGCAGLCCIAGCPVGPAPHALNRPGVQYASGTLWYVSYAFKVSHPSASSPTGMLAVRNRTSPVGPWTLDFGLLSMGRFWYTLPIPQSVPRKLLLHNGFGLVGHLGHFEMASRENKSLQAAALAPPDLPSPARCRWSATKAIKTGLWTLDFGLWTVDVGPESLRTNLSDLTHFLRIKSAKSTVFTEVLTGLRIKEAGTYIPPSSSSQS